MKKLSGNNYGTQRASSSSMRRAKLFQGHRRVASVMALGIGAWLLLLSIFFWRERMLFADAPHILFRLLNDGALQIQEYRWGAFITQGVALLASKVGLPLKAVMMLYSASFNLFYLAVIALLIRRYSRPDLALIFALYLILPVTETFYWPNNEVHQGIGWLMLAAGEHSLGLARRRPVGVRVGVFAVLMTLALWTHPLVMLAAGFLWMFGWLQGGKSLGHSFTERAALTLILAAVALWKYLYAHRYGWYDAGKLEAIDRISLESIPKAFRSAVAHGFLKSVGKEYAALCIVWLAGLAALLANRRYALAGLILLFSFGYFFLVAHTHGSFERFYIESEWAPMTFAAATPFVLYGLERICPKLAMVLLSGIVLWQSILILQGARPFRDRLAYNSGVISEMRARSMTKALLAESGEALRDRLKLYWASGVESMMQSALNGERPQRTFVFAPASVLDSLAVAARRDSLYNPWEMRSAQRLNPRYFLLDTASYYRIYQ